MGELLEIIGDTKEGVTPREAVGRLEADGFTPADASNTLLEALESGQVTLGERYRLVRASA